MKKIIKDILDNFAEKGFVFSNEQDFQFEMALALKAIQGIKNVKLETLSLDEDWNSLIGKKKVSKSIKQYHDILVELTNGDVYLIELKYKTPQKLCFYETKQGKMITFAQGAYDIGAYEFLKDISRLENIKSRYMSRSIQERIKKSFSVILTNDRNYRFNEFNKETNGKESPWKNYSIAQGKEFKKGYILFNTNNPLQYVTPKGKKFDAITLNNDYKPFEWNNYELEHYKDFENENGRSNCPGFSYLIVEVET